MFKVNGVLVQGWHEDAAVEEYADRMNLDIWDVETTSIEEATVREVLVEAYGDDWVTALNHLVDVGRRSVMQRLTDERGFADFSWEYFDCIVLRNTCGNEIHGYADRLGIANYRVLSDEWSHLDALTDGPYSGSDHISLDLDCIAPHDLTEVLQSLEDHPVLSDDEYSKVEMEMIDEHWESYGRRDAHNEILEGLGYAYDGSLTEYGEELIEWLVPSGQLSGGNGGGYPYVIDESAVEFNAVEMTEWIRGRIGSKVTFGNAYGPSKFWDMRLNKLFSFC